MLNFDACITALLVAAGLVAFHPALPDDPRWVTIRRVLAQQGEIEDGYDEVAASAREAAYHSPMPIHRIGATLAFGAICVSAVHAQRPTRVDTVALQRILISEDLRGTGAAGIAPIVDGLSSRDTLIRRVAVRAIGRLQKPELAAQLYKALSDPVPAVRAEAGNAITQSVSRATRRASDPLQADVKWAAGAIMGALNIERDASVSDALAGALGRLPFGDSTTARSAEAAILARGNPGFGAARGLYWIAANRATTGGLSASAITLLRSATRPPNDPAIRRVAILALIPMDGLDSATIVNASSDTDEQVRRLVLNGLGLRRLSPGARATVVRNALADPAPIVRIAAIAMARLGSLRPDCTPIVAATSDPEPYVAMAAVDALGMTCADSAAALVRLRELMTRVTTGRSGNSQIAAHALRAYSRLPGASRTLAEMYSNTIDRVEQVYAARAAAVLRDTGVLLRLANSSDHNVREAAIAGLSTVSKHVADSIYIAALSSPGYQVVRAAAFALAGTQHPAALAALLDNLDRITRERRENSRDPRMAVLQRIAELGSASTAARMTPYLADFDTTVAMTVATMLTRWTGTAVAARPVPLPVAEEPLAGVFLARNTVLRVTMAPASGGGTFTIRLFNDEAPATAARIIKLVRAHYYDGHVFQRVEPNFVVQGGGPDANEYVGDAAFMRDELTARSHLRGTLGISSRGRDTGDAQWFFNLVDNTRLDHDYTVFGIVVAGMDVVERILEGDAIGNVTINDRR